ncbi:MAG: class I SAM-dependent methyltransferase [Spirochaetia bacterium]|nr:class I SAM-dependent methyltransferase [Spirochaetia bacterium]
MICPVCESARTYLWENIKYQNYNLFIRKCVSCSSLFQFPEIKDANSLYQQKYYEGDADYSYYDERKSHAASKIVYLSRLKNIHKFINKGFFLDVGCSFGGFAYTASDYYQSFGIDVSNFSIKEGTVWLKSLDPKNNFKGIYKGSLINLPKINAFKKNHFDIITMIEVAEHLKNPLANFKSAYDLLNKNGLLIIQTANFDAWQAINAGKNYHYFLPGHLVYFSAKALEKALKKIGFRKFIQYTPVDFSLNAKLRKSGRNFTGFFRYLKWLSIVYYHLKSYLRKKERPLTSSFVLYAFK